MRYYSRIASSRRLAAVATCAALASAAGAQTRPVFEAAPAAAVQLPPVEALGTGDPTPARPAKPALQAFSTVYHVAGGVGEVTVPGVVNVAALLAEDAQLAATGDKTLRFGVGRDVVLTLASGAWAPIPGVGQLWTADVVSSGALDLRAHFAGMNLPAGVQVVVYSPTDPAQVYGPYEGAGLFGTGEFWTPTTSDERLRIEMLVPNDALGQLPAMPFMIDRVQHVYRDPVREAVLRTPNQCQMVACQFPTWQNIAAASGGIGFIGQNFLYCSGTMMNTLAGDLTPYWMTANHCLSTQADAQSSEVFWDYQAATCGGAVPSLTSVPRSSVCTLVSTGATSDYTLLMIEGTLPGGRYWSGWVGGLPSNGTASAGIHHPGGADKKISFGSMAGTANPCSGSGHLQVNWSGSGTEPGSSGSGIFRSDTQQLYGHLHCGPSSCAPTSSADGYGSFVSDYANAAVSSALAAGSDDGFEPNDSCAAARAVGAGTANGLIVKSTSQDWYSISLAPGQTLTATINFTHAWGDIDEALYDGCGGTLIGLSNGVGNSESITYQNTNGFTQTVYLNVYLFSDTRNQYNMTIGIANATAPANNNCASAATIGNGVTNFATFGATTDGPAETLCNNAGDTQVGSDIWYRYIATCTGTFTVSLCGSNYDSKLAVYSGACPAAANTANACNDDFCGVQSQLTFAATYGSQYMIRIGGYFGAVGQGTITITPPAGPANDNCASAIAIGNGATAFSNACASTDGPAESGCPAFINQDIWYRYTAGPCGGNVSVTTCGSTFDTTLAIYNNTCPSAPGAVIVCNDDSCGLQSQVSFNAAGNTSYLIRVGGFGSANGSGTLTITPQGPANDNCANAIAIGNGTFSGTTCGATTDGPDDGAGCNFAASSITYNDVWYRYTAPCTTAVRVILCNAGFDTKVSVYGSACPAGPGLALACNDDSCGLQSQATFNATAGQQYLIRIGAYTSFEAGSIPFTVRYAADWDANGTFTPADIALYVNSWFASLTNGDHQADFDNNNVINPADIAAFVNAWFQALTNHC